MITNDRIKELTMYVDTNIRIEDVILSEENKLEVNRIIKETKNRKLLNAYGLNSMNKILMYGDSGCGKTFLAKALSNHLGMKMLYIDIASSLDRGDVTENISDIFEYANEAGNCVIFLDECDSIAWNRNANDSDGAAARKATNSIFQQMDQMNQSNIMVSATNMLKRIDTAFIDRFDNKLMFERPKGGIDEIIRKFTLDKFIIHNDSDDITRDIINRNMNLSYRTIQKIVNTEMKRAVMESGCIQKEKIGIKISNIYNMIAVRCNIDFNE